MQADEDVLGGYAGPVDDLVAVDDADPEPCQVVFVVAIYTGHFGGLSADQRASGFLASSGHPGDEHLAPLDVEPAHGHIVEKEHRVGSIDDDIVHDHAHQIYPDVLMAVGHQRDLDFRAHSIGGGYEHRILIAREIQPETACEPAYPTNDLRPVGGLHDGLDSLDQEILFIDIDACFLVSQ